MTPQILFDRAFCFGVALYEALRPLTGEPSLAPALALDLTGITLCPGDTLTISTQEGAIVLECDASADTGPALGGPYWYFDWSQGQQSLPDGETLILDSDGTNGLVLS